MHTDWVVCTPWPHVTEHEVPAPTQLYWTVGWTKIGAGVLLEMKEPEPPTRKMAESYSLSPTSRTEMLSIDGVFATTTPSAISWSVKPVRKNSG
jgi:hypothetical protein